MAIRSLATISCLVFFAGHALGQGIDSAAIARRVAGCWTVTTGPFEPPISLGADTVFAYPPAHIVLDSSRGHSPFAGRGWVLQPPPEAQSGMRWFSFFLPIGADSLELIWTTGYSGRTIRAAIARDTLRGLVRTFWDFPRPDQYANVLMVRGCR